MDDKFDPKTAGENARVLIEDKKVHVMFLTRGAPHTEAIIPHLDKHGVALVGLHGRRVLHQPVRKHVFNVRATYQREAEEGRGPPWPRFGHDARRAVLYADDSFGADGAGRRAGAWRRPAGARGAGEIPTAPSPTSLPGGEKIARARAQA